MKRAAPKPAHTPSGAEPGHGQSSGLFVPGEGLSRPAQCALQGRSSYSTIGGHTSLRAERRAAPKPARTPSGGRSSYSTIGGHT
jgi:hypothetical protein